MRLHRRVALLLFFLVAAVLAYVLPGYFFTQLQASRPKVSASAAVASSTPEESANLAYYIEAERLDPIFAIEGTDPQKLRAAVASLFQERDMIGLEYPPAERSTIETALYPSAFLAALPDLEASRQTVFTDPTVVHAQKYHLQLDQTIGLYALGARAVANAIQSVSSTIPSVGYIGGTASTTDIAAKIQKIASLALLQKEKEDARYQCLEHFSSSCPTVASLKGSQQAALAAPPALPAPSSSVYKADALWRQILVLLPQFISASKALYAIPSDCFAVHAAYLREYYSGQLPDGMARKQMLVNDLYFNDVPGMLQVDPNLASLEALTGAGVTVESQNMGNLYECADSGFDVTSVGSIIGTLNLIVQKQTPTAEEQKLLSLPVVQKADLAPYVARAAAGNAPAGNALAERYLEGSADFDQTILGAYGDNHFLVTTWNKTRPAEYAFVISARNFASTMLLLGNPTFVPQRVSLFSDTTPNAPAKLFLRTYLNDVSKQYTDAQILTQVKSSINIAVAP